MKTGNDIPIEERSADEVRCIGGKNIAPKGVTVFNPAFDVTPHTLISAIITEFGVIRQPYNKAIAQLEHKNKTKEGKL
jgi:methylthioribose-1-phosphate isomerase